MVLFSKGEERETGTERRKGIEIVTGTETRRENETEEKKDQGMRGRKQFVSGSCQHVID